MERVIIPIFAWRSLCHGSGKLVSFATLELNPFGA